MAPATAAASLSLLNRAERVSLAYWPAPVVAAAVVLTAVTVLMLRQNTLPDARKEGLRFASAFAAVAFAAALLVRITGSASSSSFGSLDQRP